MIKDNVSIVWHKNGTHKTLTAFLRHQSIYCMAQERYTQSPGCILAPTKGYPGSQLIHHSDRGIQYCSKEYVRLSELTNALISMTENGDPYENALAERMNRTLKDEFGLGRRLPSK